MFAAADWQVLTCKWGSRIQRLFQRPGGQVLCRRMDDMHNEEYQRLLRSHPDDVHERVMAGAPDDQRGELDDLLGELSARDLAEVVRDLAGHDIPLLVDTFAQIDATRPTVIFAYTIKGRGLATEGHPGNHSAQLTGEQMAELADISHTSLDDPWQRFDDDSPAGRLCAQTALRLRREPTVSRPMPQIPAELGWKPKAMTSTQSALGRFLSDVTRSHPDVSDRIVTISADVRSEE